MGQPVAGATISASVGVSSGITSAHSGGATTTATTTKRGIGGTDYKHWFRYLHSQGLAEGLSQLMTLRNLRVNTDILIAPGFTLSFLKGIHA